MVARAIEVGGDWKKSENDFNGLGVSLWGHKNVLKELKLSISYIVVCSGTGISIWVVWPYA